EGRHPGDQVRGLAREKGDHPPEELVTARQALRHYPPAVFVPPAKPINPLKSIEGCHKSLTILSASVKQSDALMWHRRLGHVSLKRIIKMCAAGNLPGLPGKLTNKDFPMDIIVSDVLGPFVEGFSGVQYLVVFRDLTSTYSEGFLLKAKKDAVAGSLR
ncbi:uncharacterized protein VP01_2697g1, partial [Puccinia sorghi]